MDIADWEVDAYGKNGWAYGTGDLKMTVEGYVLEFADRTCKCKINYVIKLQEKIKKQGVNLAFFCFVEEKDRGYNDYFLFGFECKEGGISYYFEIYVILSTTSDGQIVVKTRSKTKKKDGIYSNIVLKNEPALHAKAKEVTKVILEECLEWDETRMLMLFQKVYINPELNEMNPHR